MGKQITFLRHYKLEYPYDSWLNMTVEEFTNLTTGGADPNINKDIDNFLKENNVLNGDHHYEIILTSNYLRTQQTAQALKDFYQIDSDIKRDSIFNEIPSEILVGITEADFRSMKESNKLTLNKRRVLNREEKIQRLLEINKCINNLSENKILIISHSYLIGQLNYFFNVLKRVNVSNFDETKADKCEIGGYLKGFTIEI